MSDSTTAPLSFSTALTVPFDEAVARTREAFAAQGFGVLTEIDVTATLRTKIGAEIEDILILGACNPTFAHRALQSTRAVALMMPCNVVVRRDPEDEERVLVEALNPAMMVDFAGGDGSDSDSDSGSGEDAGLAAVAEDAAARVSAAVVAVADA